MKDLGIHNDDPILVHDDNQTCIALAESETGKARTKHIGIRYANMNDAVQMGLIKLKYCPTEEMVADVFTKPLSSTKHYQMVQKLGMMNMP